MVKAFNFTNTPNIVFGPGSFDKAAKLIRKAGRNALIVTGADSHKESGRWDKLVEAMERDETRWHHFAVKGEPTPELVDKAVAEFGNKNINIVLAWGGGSAIDAGKAISAMIPQKGPVVNYLENVGTGAKHNGIKVPFIAAPTTAGTGSEATKNAVLRRVGPDGFKNSLRHDELVPDTALIDPELMLSCPAAVTAACGMDAFSQLLESYVSTNSNPMTDALALSGMELIRDNLTRACGDGAGDVNVRGGMAYAALMSGITLANAGLGLVHGLAGPIGGLHDIPHGVVCGTLMASVFSATIDKLLENPGSDALALRKFARAGSLLMCSGMIDIGSGCRMLVERIEEWTETLKIPRLGAYGIKESDLDAIVAAASNKYNPVQLSPSEIRDVLLKRL
ncbi:MAG: iron-containing alcohol dehydrogenase [bacterium]